MSFENLTEDNIMLYAAKAYDRPNCIMSEFTEDMKRLNYLKRLFRRYSKHGEMRDYSILKTYLLFLNLMPERVRGINGTDIISSEIPVDMNVAEVLRNLK